MSELHRGAQPRVECFFDCSSPWTYLGFVTLRRMREELGFAIAWRPVLVGAVFNSVNPSVYASRERPIAPKQNYLKSSLAQWSRQAGVAVTFPPRVFPVNSAKAMRCCLALQARPDGDRLLEAFALGAFEAYFGQDLDISQDEVLATVAATMGLDARELLAQQDCAEVRQQLRASTDELIARGGFGSPTFFVGKTMVFGNDHLPLVRQALASGT
ncbi:2-hydroxychromene-2-carboxylate isomerase [Xenophilus sp. Marseille-Q4582]|uniref:2-hydroxychromene-2-carboxylate isomerase n=1 Tax=Xenophilus sp. Marseille-Q4582 TaxID=2866600 RepID=UPI001CE3BD41|nr:2-hydroxychromene-2-carboxylate isomerase [Xenophilus sp. Marseille-Q4582]